MAHPGPLCLLLALLLAAAGAADALTTPTPSAPASDCVNQACGLGSPLNALATGVSGRARTGMGTQRHSPPRGWKPPPQMRPAGPPAAAAAATEQRTPGGGSTRPAPRRPPQPGAVQVQATLAKIAKLAVKCDALLVAKLRKNKCPDTCRDLIKLQSGLVGARTRGACVWEGGGGGGLLGAGRWRVGAPAAGYRPWGRHLGHRGSPFLRRRLPPSPNPAPRPPPAQLGKGCLTALLTCPTAKGARPAPSVMRAKTVSVWSRGGGGGECLCVGGRRLAPGHRCCVLLWGPHPAPKPHPPPTTRPRARRCRPAAPTSSTWA